MLGDPPDVGDGLVEVVDEDLADARPALGELAAPVVQPAVVRPDAGRRRGNSSGVGVGDYRPGGEERRHRVGKDQLADDAVGLEPRVAALVVPVALTEVAAGP